MSCYLSESTAAVGTVLKATRLTATRRILSESFAIHHFIGECQIFLGLFSPFRPLVSGHPWQEPAFQLCILFSGVGEARSLVSNACLQLATTPLVVTILSTPS